MSDSKSGKKNQYFGKSLPKATLDAAAELAGTPIYVYTEDNFTLVNEKPFRSIRDTAKNLPVGASTLPKILDTNISFKGYYYYTKPQYRKP